MEEKETEGEGFRKEEDMEKLESKRVSNLLMFEKRIFIGSLPWQL